MKLLPEREAATFLRLSARTLKRKRITGDGPRYVKLGRRVLYRDDHLFEYLEENVRRNTSEKR
jgi:hypothetical protein